MAMPFPLTSEVEVPHQCSNTVAWSDAFITDSMVDRRAAVVWNCGYVKKYGAWQILPPSLRLTGG